jgi:hypothetical protein
MVEFPWLGLSYQLPITDMLWQMLVALPASPAGDSRQRAGLMAIALHFNGACAPEHAPNRPLLR